MSFKTESEVIAILKPIVSGFHPNTKVRVGKSTQSNRGLTREVTFFIIIPIEVDRDVAIKSLNELTVEYLSKDDYTLYFSGSEAGLLHGDQENDWLFITAEITENL